MTRMKTCLFFAVLALAAGTRVAAAWEVEDGAGGDVVLVTQETAGYPGDEIGETNLYARAHYTWLANPNLAVFVEGELGRGNGLWLGGVQPHWGVNDTADGTGGYARTRQFYVRTVGTGTYGGLVGQVDLSEHFSRNEFAKNEFSQFMAPGLVTDPSIDFPAGETLSAMLSFTPAPGMSVRLACGEYTPGYWDDIFHEDGFWITEFEQKLGDEGKVLVDLWTGPVMDEEPGLPAESGHPTGLSVSFDYEVNGLGIFAKYGVRSPSLYAYNQVLSGGVVYEGPALGKKNALGAGFLLTSPSPDFTGGNDGVETQIEVFFRWELSSGLQIIPDLQLISNPRGDTSDDPLAIVGVRMHVPF